jgi:FTR1 family protein
MFEALVITLREGVEAALVLAIASGILRRQGRGDQVGPLLAGAGLALAVSVLLAFLATRITYNEEIVEGVGMLVGAVFVLTLTVWMWRTAPRIKEEITSGLARGAAAGGLGVAVFGFVMVVREGFETAIFLAAAEFNSSGLMLWVGALVGLALAATFGVLFARGALKVPLKPFFALTTAVLLLVAFQLLVGGLHELSEGNVLPSSRTEMAIVGPIVKNELLLFTLTLALAVGWMLSGAGRTAGAATSPATPAPEAPKAVTPPEAPKAATSPGAPKAVTSPQALASARLARAVASRDASWRRALSALGVIVVGLLAWAFIGRARIPGAEPATRLAPEAGAVSFDSSVLDDGRLHFFETPLAANAPARWNGAARFFAIRVGAEVRTNLDACQICGPIGYFLEGGAAVCRNCTSPIALGSLARSGGCNPIPVRSRVEGARVIVSVADLEKAVPLAKGR